MFDRFEACLDAAVPDIAADPDPEPADQLRVLPEFRGDVAEPGLEPVGEGGRLRGVHRDRAFDDRVAAGKLELAANKNVPIPEGWAVDREGRPATAARQYLEEGGAMLPFAGHKGYALMLLIELLAGALTGAGVTQRPEVVSTGCLGFAGNATFLIVLDVAHFTDVEQFGADVDGLFNRLNGVRPAPGFQKVIVPGEPEAEQRAKRAREGISVDGVIWEQIMRIAAESQVDLADI